jgi:hypothetical protein
MFISPNSLLSKDRDKSEEEEKEESDSKIT